MSISPDILLKAQNFRDWDPNLETKQQVSDLIDSNNHAELEKIFGNRISFGTAGLRAAMGPGYTRMNDLVVLQTCQGLACYLEEVFGETSARERGIVVGYDHRQIGNLSSRGFAEITAAVFMGRGFKVHLLENFVATPFVAFGVTHLNCVAGIMVTASHNPKADNGYKVYFSNGCQIIPPHDANISHHISLHLQPWTTISEGEEDGENEQFEYQRWLKRIRNIGSMSESERESSLPLLSLSTPQVSSAYFQTIAPPSSPSLSPSPSSSVEDDVDLKVAYTAMHGVGHQWMNQATSLFSLPAFHPVPTQCVPDPTFPTVSFPNPEEKGALNEAMRFATDTGCTLIIANDPDADRLAVAELISSPSQSSSSTPSVSSSVAASNWHVFSGNEIGVILGHWLIHTYKEKQRKRQEVDGAREGEKAAVLASVVSSRMLRQIALENGVEYYDTLTGFKWLGNTARMLIEKHKIPSSSSDSSSDSLMSVLFSYEEALGYCVGDVLADKDGINAGCVFVQMARELKRGTTMTTSTTPSTYPSSSSEGLPTLFSSSVKEHYDWICGRYGLFLSYNSYVFSHDSQVTDRIFSRLRVNGGGATGGYWESCCGVKITAVQDITLGYDSSAPAPEYLSSMPATPDAHMIMFSFENQVSVTLRTSGTEPKIKFYTEIAGKPERKEKGEGEGEGEMESLQELRERLRGKLVSFVEGLVEEMLDPKENGLTRP